MHSSSETATIHRLEVQHLVKYYPIIIVLRSHYSHFIDEELEAQKQKETWPRSDTNKAKSQNQNPGPPTPNPKPHATPFIEASPPKPRGRKNRWMAQRNCGGGSQKSAHQIAFF